MADDPLAEQLVWLLEQCRAYTLSRDTLDIKDRALDATLVLSGAERAFFFNADERGRLTLHRGKTTGGNLTHDVDSKVNQVVSQVLKDRRAILATDSARAVAMPGPVSELRLKQLVCMPIVSDSEAFGVLYADGKVHSDKVVQSRVLEILASVVGTALENAHMFERATNDLLTGMPNNSNFLFHLSKSLRTTVASSQGGVVLLDLDSFKRVNQAAGAEMGDRALIDIAHTLREVLRTDGMVARYGSDKFAILLAPESDTPIALRLRDVAERARAAVGTKTYHGVQLSACLGGVCFPTGKDKQGASEVIALADDALARARSRGPGQVEIV